jgi:hypothetical protein
MGNSTGEYRVMVRTTEGGRPLRRSRRGWKDNIEMDPTQVGWKGSDRIDLAEDKERWRVLMNAVLGLQIP